LRRISHDRFDPGWGARAGDPLLDPARTTIRADVKAMSGLTTVHGTFRLQSGQVSNTRTWACVASLNPGNNEIRAAHGWRRVWRN
jgi:hypothetical protein